MEEREEEREGMVKAIKDGHENWFSTLTWKLMECNRNGWELYSDISSADSIPTDEIKLDNIKIKEQAAKIKELEALLAKGQTSTNDEPDATEMKAYLKEKGIDFHHRAGEKTIKKLYNENRE